VATWAEFAAAAPEIAEAGKKLFYQHGVGLGYIATVRPDGGPPMHPFCPVITDDGLYAFIIPSPKREDLLRDGRYAMHTFPPEAVDDEFYLVGQATPVADAAKRAAIAAGYHFPVPDGHQLFTFDVERCLLVTYKFRGDMSPTHKTWRDPAK
jgi:hypothetical protein